MLGKDTLERAHLIYVVGEGALSLLQLSLELNNSRRGLRRRSLLLLLLLLLCRLFLRTSRLPWHHGRQRRRVWLEI